jgi:hypothetical protein
MVFGPGSEDGIAQRIGLYDLGLTERCLLMVAQMHHLGGCLAARADLVVSMKPSEPTSSARVKQTLEEYLSLIQSRIEHDSMNFASKLRIIG